MTPGYVRTWQAKFGRRRRRPCEPTVTDTLSCVSNARKRWAFPVPAPALFSALPHARARLRDELGHSAISAARPLQAAGASAASFFLGGLLPLLGLLAATATARLWLIVAVTLVGLAVTGSSAPGSQALVWLDLSCA
jgi:hypothetical protein